VFALPKRGFVKLLQLASFEVAPIQKVRHVGQATIGKVKVEGGGFVFVYRANEALNPTSQSQYRSLAVRKKSRCEEGDLSPQNLEAIQS
jgi:hypothetical protein